MNIDNGLCVLNTKSSEVIRELPSFMLTVNARNRRELSSKMEGVLNTLEFTSAVFRHVIMFSGWQDKLIPTTGSWLAWMTPAHVKGKIVGIVKDLPLTAIEGGIKRFIIEDVFVYGLLGEHGHMVLGLHAIQRFRASIELYPHGKRVTLLCMCNPVTEKTGEAIAGAGVVSDVIPNEQK